jgi:hypothetical protein
MPRIRRWLEVAAFFVVAGVAYSNVWTFQQYILSMPPADELAIQEERYKQIRALLNAEGYSKGPVAFISKRDLMTAEAFNSEDFKRWAQGQYVMVPWNLLRPDGRAVSDVVIQDANPPFAIADFWDGEPPTIPDNLVRIYDSGKGLVLFRRKATP